MLSHFLVGAARSVFTGRGVFRSGMDMFVVGVGVAVVGYFVGLWVARLLLERKKGRTRTNTDQHGQQRTLPAGPCSSVVVCVRPCLSWALRAALRGAASTVKPKSARPRFPARSLTVAVTRCGPAATDSVRQTPEAALGMQIESIGSPSSRTLRVVGSRPEVLVRIAQTDHRRWIVRHRTRARDDDGGGHGVGREADRARPSRPARSRTITCAVCFPSTSRVDGV